MAHLYANVAQLSREQGMALAFNMVTALPDRTVGRCTRPAMLEVGRAATIVLVDAAEPAGAVREVGRVIGGWKAGRDRLWNGRPRIFHPARQDRRQLPAVHREGLTRAWHETCVSSIHGHDVEARHDSA
jgi:cytosine/adenosine deaminase-related metal-dependent hydrolase